MQNRLLYKGRIVISKTLVFIPQLLREYHDSPVGGHSGDIKTYLMMATYWFWTRMRKDIATYVQKCLVCQQHKTSTQQPAVLLQALLILSQVWDHITLDFIEGLPPQRVMIPSWW